MNTRMTVLNAAVAWRLRLAGGAFAVRPVRLHIGGQYLRRVD